MSAARAWRAPRRLAFSGLLMAGLGGLFASQLTAASPAKATAVVQAGNAASNAAIMGVVPAAAGLTLTTSAGQASTAYEQNLTQASAWTLDMGGLGVLLENLGLCGHTLPPSAVPPPLTADSENGSSSRTTAGNVGGAGTESVSVSPSPEYAIAAVSPVTQVVPGVLQVSGTSASAVRYTANTEQEADASVTETVSFLNGLVRIEGMKWMARREMGTANSQSATFTFGTVVIGKTGIPVTLPSTAPAATVVKAINSVLGIFGLTVVLPVESVAPATDTVAIGPLQLVFQGSALDNKLLSPLNSGVVDLERLIAGQSQPGTNCANVHQLLYQFSNSADGVVNLAVAAAEGSGSISIDLGGASAQVQPATNYTNPFGGGGALPPSLPPSGLGGAPLPSAAVVPSSAGQVAAAPASTGSPATSPPFGGQPVAAKPATQRTTSAGSSLVRCVTTSPAGGTGCWRGLGSVAALVVAVLGAGLLAADLVYSNRVRRRRRRRARRAVL